MRKRDRLRAILAPSATGACPASPHLPPAPRASSPPSSAAANPITSQGPTPTRTPVRNSALEKAITLQLQKIPANARADFERELNALDEQALLSKVRAYDVDHQNDSSFRPHAERLTKVLCLLNRLMGGVAIGIQADPAISAPVVGAIRVLIDLGLQFTAFFARLTDMIGEFEDYLQPLAEHSLASDLEFIETAVVSVYVNILDFSWKARCVFVDANGEPRRWTSFRAFMRQHWDTFEAEFTSMKAEMQHNLHVLQHTVQATHFNAYRKDEQRKERSAFLAWLSDIDFEEVHQSTYAKKHKDTGNWLIKESKFQQWMQNPHSSLLWCNGKPGIGKSVLSSNVLEHITAETGLREGTATCFAYYDYRDTRLANINRIIAALIKQICQRRHDIPGNLLQLMRDARSPSLVGSQEYFFLLAESFSEVFVVFDALDECPEKQRQDILSFIIKLVTMPASCRFKVFVTSRKESDISEAFVNNHVPTVQILAGNVAADVEKFVHDEVEELQTGKLGKRLFVSDERLKEKIIQTLATQAEGMFLWVNLQLDSLCQASKIRKDQVVEAALVSLPQDLPATYARILDRIENQHSSMRNLAMNCLTWTIYARRPLRTKELQHALAIDPKFKIGTDLQLESPELILEACGNLLEEVNGRIRPIHYTVQEFFTPSTEKMPQHAMRTQLLDTNCAHRQMGLVCLAYIQQLAFNTPELKDYKLYSRTGKCPFAAYAYQSFDYHISYCNETPPDVMDQLDRLFRQETLFLAAILQIILLRGGHDYYSIKQRFMKMDFHVTPGTIVYSTSLYKIPAIRKRWIGQTPPIYALHLASSAGMTSAVDRLLEGGYNVDEKDGTGSASLYYACSNGHLNVVQSLVSKGANIHARGGYYGDALQVASAEGHEEIVRILLDNNVNVNAQGGYYGNALQAAAGRGHREIVRILLDNNANVNAQGGGYGNALQAATGQGHKHVVKLLLEAGAEGSHTLC